MKADVNPATSWVYSSIWFAGPVLQESLTLHAETQIEIFIFNVSIMFYT